MEMKVRELLADSVEVKRLALDDASLLTTVAASAESIVRAFRAGGKVRFCGNGGSAADAQHLAAELSGRFLLDRPGLDAEALHTNASYLTAVANDYSFAEVYSRLVLATCHRGDVIVGMSTSGNSANVVAALSAARGLGVTAIGMTGQSGGRMADLCDLILRVPSSSTPRIQECHLTLGHIICHIVEMQLFGERALGVG